MPTTATTGTPWRTNVSNSLRRVADRAVPEDDPHRRIRVDHGRAESESCAHAERAEDPGIEPVQRAVRAQHVRRGRDDVAAVADDHRPGRQGVRRSRGTVEPGSPRRWSHLPARRSRRPERRPGRGPGRAMPPSGAGRSGRHRRCRSWRARHRRVSRRPGDGSSAGRCGSGSPRPGNCRAGCGCRSRGGSRREHRRAPRQSASAQRLPPSVPGLQRVVGAEQAARHPGEIDRRTRVVPPQHAYGRRCLG